MRIRYGRWSGTQNPLGTDVTADDVLDEVADDLIAGMDPAAAVRRLLRAGMSGRVPGLEELRRRVAEARRREQSRLGLDGPLEAIRRELDRIVDTERAALDLADLARAGAAAVDGGAETDDGAETDGDAGDGADAHDRVARHEALDDLPEDTAGRVAALRNYDFYDERARSAFENLLASLRRDVADATFGRLAQALGQAKPEDLSSARDFVADINAMVAARDRGEDIGDAWERFRERHADALGAMGDPSTLDELLEEMARRMAAMSALMAGMSPEQRQQLAELASQLLDDVDLQFQMDQLRRTLEREFGALDWGQPVPGVMPTGEEEGSLAQTVDWVERLQRMDDLAEALGQDYPGARLEDVDEESLRGVLGDEAADALDALRAIERALEEAGALTRHEGRLELTPRGIRRLGERSLARIFDRTANGPVGDHEAVAIGGEGELTGSTRAWQFGDPFRLDVGRTIGNAVRRGPRPDELPDVGGRRTGRVDLDPEDFELAEAQRRVRTVTVLLLDMSFSMPLRGNWGPAKRVALALQALIASKFPQDRFHIIGFSDYARRLQPQDLLVSGWERVYGTNMQHAFMLARRVLDADPAAERQLIMVTDGEPTAHLEGDYATFAWPPEGRTLQLTMQEATRLSRRGTTLNVFLLDHDPGAALFVERMVSRVGGRIFYPDLEDLGHLVVRDYLRQRRS